MIEVWQRVLRAAELLPDASELRASVRATADGYAFVVEGGHRWPHASRFADAVPVLTEIWWRRARSAPEKVDAQKVESRQGQRRRRPKDGRKATGSGDACVALADQPVMIRSDARRTARRAHRSSRSTLEMAAALHADVVARALAYAPATVADAYAGTGATALPLAQHGVHVTAVEADPDAAAHCASMMPAGCQAVTARVEDVLPVLLAADVVDSQPAAAGRRERRHVARWLPRRRRARDPARSFTSVVIRRRWRAMWLG